LVVDDDDDQRRITEFHLRQLGYRTLGAADPFEALDLLVRTGVDLVLADLHLQSESGLDLLKGIRTDYPEIPVVMMTAHGTIDTALEAMKAGAQDYLAKPLHPDELEIVLCRALGHRDSVGEARPAPGALSRYGFESIIGMSRPILEVLDSASRVAPTDSTVLVLGETGTGKGLLARAIHESSSRRTRPMVSLNCASIPRELLESELFGFVKGSFTGALAHKKGRIEVAEGGTVFLDEIGEMPLDLQVRLLRLIEEHEIEKVGAVSPIKVDVRIIAATHRKLENLVDAGAFREDLYYRLAVVPISLPPLRDRAEDIPYLVHEFFERSKIRHGKPDMQLSGALLPIFTHYPWPGNVRELQNVIERIVLLTPSKVINAGDLPEFLRHRPGIEPRKRQMELEGATLESVERNLILEALRRFDWNQTQAARHLAITRKALMYRIAKHGIEKETHESVADRLESAD
jgi:two-component system NtrC family response regulator